MRPYHISIPRATYFITVRCARATVPFSRDTACNTYLETVVRKMREFGFNLFAYVVMPDHIHLMVKLPENISLQKMMNHINGATAREINIHTGTTGQKFWQGGFFDVRIRGTVDFCTKVNYIHNNPVRAGLAPIPEDYTYSSAKVYLKNFGFALLNASTGDRVQIRNIRGAIPDLLMNELTVTGKH